MEASVIPLALCKQTFKREEESENRQKWKFVPISFPKMQSEDFSEMPIVISCKIEQTGITIMKVHVDNGSSVDIVYEQCFVQLPESIRLGITALGKFGIVPSTIHGMIKFKIAKGVATISSASVIPICAAVNVKNAVQEGVDAADNMVVVNPEYPDQKIKVGLNISADTKKQIVQLLVEYMDVFAWCENDMTGVPCYIAEHKLNVNPALKLVVQKRRGMALDRTKWLCEEVTKLVAAGILREVQYQSWIANPVLVKKPDGSWRICIDFKDLNKACPKDNYPLSEIDLKVESLHAFPYKCFLDAARGYHQIPMAREDADKTVFHTGKGIFSYIMMPFGLINAGATYQRLIDTTFETQIGRNLEAYVDDLVIKSTMQARILDDMRETFDTLRRINMKLNPSKCSFGETEGKFLGYLVTEQGIQANPKKIAAIENMTAPKTVKEVQSLTGKLAALMRLLSKAAESKALAGSEINYVPIEKFMYALILTSRRLRRYFQGHPVHVLTNILVKQVLTKIEISGRLAFWAVELGTYEIFYLPRNAIKGQVFADYLTEMSGELEVINGRTELKPVQGETWDLFTDGASCAEGAGAGLVLASPSGEEHTYALRFNFDVTNNEVEYEAFLAGLYIEHKMNVTKLRAFTDS
ncbi:uncharacterized protein [Rutidosis leptorrhynchoides]|uniref:uncharacterized protein n=1 Tax=Rutidosis leptorrhynchoides TaxID=125765 RepID=UPI003A99BA1E